MFDSQKFLIEKSPDVKVLSICFAIFFPITVANEGNKTNQPKNSLLDMYSIIPVNMSVRSGTIT